MIIRNVQNKNQYKKGKPKDNLLQHAKKYMKQLQQE